MTESEATQAILELWEDGWDTLHPASDPEFVPYTYRNETFETTDLGELGAWVRLTIQHSTSRQLTQGSAPHRKWERRGSVFVQVFAPIDQGQSLCSILADDVRSTLEGRRALELNLYETTTADQAEDGAWMKHVLVTRFRYVDTR